MEMLSIRSWSAEVIILNNRAVQDLSVSVN